MTAPAGTKRSQRKAALIAQGEQFRAQLTRSRTALHAGLQGPIMARSALDHLSGKLPHWLGVVLSLTQGGAVPRQWLSFAFGAASLVSRKRLWRPLLWGVLIAATVGVVASSLNSPSRRRSASAEPKH
jgi:hypothetical protein